MTLAPTREGQLEALQLVLSRQLVLRLFVNDIDPDSEMVWNYRVSDFEELNSNSYEPKVLNPKDWSFGVSETDGVVAFQEEFEFGFKKYGFSVYGFFVTNKENTVVRWAERFEEEDGTISDQGPYTVLRKNDVIFVTPRLELAKPPPEPGKAKAMH